MKSVLFAVCILIAAPTVRAAEPAPTLEPAKEKAADDLDARITSLQSTKDCITNAKTRGGVTNCSTNIKIRTREVKKPDRN